MEMVAAAWPASFALPEGNATLHCGGTQRSMSLTGGGAGGAAALATAGIRAAGSLDSGWAVPGSPDGCEIVHRAGTSSRRERFSSDTSWFFDVRIELFSGPVPTLSFNPLMW